MNNAKARLKECQRYMHWAPIWEKQDEEVVAEHPCDTCGSQRRYEAYQSFKGYRPFAICSFCGRVDEF